MRGWVSQGASLFEKLALIGEAEHSMREDRQNQWEQEGWVWGGSVRKIPEHVSSVSQDECVQLLPAEDR